MAVQTIRHDIADDLYIYKQANSKRWLARFKVGKTWLAKTTKEKDKQQALIKAIQLQTEYRIKAANDLPIFTKNSKSNKFEAIAKQAIKRMDDELESGAGKGIYKDYEQAINKYHIPCFGTMQIKDIDASQLLEFDKWRVKRLGRVPAKSTVLNHNAALQRVFDEAVIRNVITHTEIPKLKNAGAAGARREAFTQEEIDLVLKQDDWWFSGRKQVSKDIKQLLWCYAYVALETGIRPGTEMEHLTWSDVRTRMEDGQKYTTITVRKGKVSKFTGTREIVCKTYAELGLVTLKLRNMHTNDDDLIFTLPSGSKTRELNRNFMRRLDMLGLIDSKLGKRSLYSLRHTYITNQILGKVPLAVLATQAGTSVTMIEQHYNHVRPIMFMKELSGKDRAKLIPKKNKPK